MKVEHNAVPSAMRQQTATALAQDQGRWARRMGLARDANPWAEGTVRARAFDAGWRTGADE